MKTITCLASNSSSLSSLSFSLISMTMPQISSTTSHTESECPSTVTLPLPLFIQILTSCLFSNDLILFSCYRRRQIQTNNVAGRHRGPKRKLRAGSALCVYSTFGHHFHPLGYLCAKFRFFRGPHCWASPWRKSHTQSITHSLTHPAYL